MVMLADDLSGLGTVAPGTGPLPVKQVLPPGSGTIPAMGGMPAMTFKPIENARNLWTLYGYWDSSKLAAAPLYYQWTYNQSVPRLPSTPPPPMGQFPTLDAARAAMMAQLSIQSPVLPQVAAVPAPQVTIPQNYAAPSPAPDDGDRVVPLVIEIPTWVKVAAGAGAAGLIVLLLMRRRSKR